MATGHTIAALLVAVVLVAVAADQDLPSKPVLRRWVRECRKDSFIAKSKPLYAFKKSIAGLFDPNSRHAFRKSKVTYAKFEFATIRRPSEAEKCLLECLAEKQGLINGTQLQPTKIMNTMMASGKAINDMHISTKVNMTRLKRHTTKCIAGTHGSTKNCDLGFRLLHCLGAAMKASLYEDKITTTTAAYPAMTETTPMDPGMNGAPSWSPPPPPPPTMSGPDRYTADSYPPPPPMHRMRPMHRMMRPMRRPMAPEYEMPPPPPRDMAPIDSTGPMEPMRPMGVMSPPARMTPSLVAYGQGSGVLKVYGPGPGSWRQRWRRTPPGMHGRPRMMGPMI